MEIGLRRGRLDVVTASFLLVYAALAAGLVALALILLDDVVLLVVLIVLAVGWALWSGLYVYNWSRMRRIDFPLALHGYGVFARSPFGELSIPWDAVHSASIERRWNGLMLRVRPVPATDPRFAAIVHADLHPKVFSAVQERGLRMSLLILDIDRDRLAEAFVVQSGGRVRLS